MIASIFLLGIGCDGNKKSSSTNEAETLSGSKSKERFKTYKVKKVDQDISLDGLSKETIWSKVFAINNFNYPWQTEATPETSFRACHDGEFLYFFFTAKDDEIILKQTGDEEMDAVRSDRCEIFIRAEDESLPYYSFEMDPLGRVFDSKGEFGKYIDEKYDYPADALEYIGLINDDEYSLEGKLKLATLKELGLLSADHEIIAGLFRGEYFTDEVGEEKTYWISWVTPDSETPNFHIPSSFGKLVLSQEVNQ